MKTKLIKKLMTLSILTTTIIGMSAQGVSAEWRQGRYGWWNAKGENYSIGWEKIGNSWFFFDQDGYMKTGWIKDGAKWYYLSPDGYMAYNTYVGDYKLGSDGAWIDGSADVNTTTGAAVEVDATTGSAVSFPEHNSNKEDKEKEKLDKFLNKVDDKIEKRIDKYEEKQEKFWKHLYK